MTMETDLTRETFVGLPKKRVEEVREELLRALCSLDPLLSAPGLEVVRFYTVPILVNSLPFYFVGEPANKPGRRKFAEPKPLNLNVNEERARRSGEPRRTL